jgi:hypothetical protein
MTDANRGQPVGRPRPGDHEKPTVSKNVSLRVCEPRRILGSDANAILLGVAPASDAHMKNNVVTMASALP